MRMNKKAAVKLLRGIKHRLEVELETCYIGDDTEIFAEMDAIDYAIKKIKQRENDHLVELEFPVKQIKERFHAGSS